MAFIRERGGKFHVVYKIKDEKGKVHQKSETFAKRKDAERRQHEVEYQIDNGIFKVAKCVTVEDLLNEYVKLYGKEKWAVTTYSANMGLINNYILPVIGKTDVSSVNNHFVEKFYRTLSNMPAVDGANNKKSKGNVSPNTIFEIHKILRSCFRQAVKWGIMEKNPAIDATLPKRNKKKREIWTAEMLMQAIEACDEKWLEAAFHLAFTATLRIGDDDDKIRLNQRKPSKYKGLSRFGPEKNLQRINKFMKERPTFYKKLIQMKENFRFYLRCFYCITKVVILQFNSEKQDRISS